MPLLKNTGFNIIVATMLLLSMVAHSVAADRLLIRRNALTAYLISCGPTSFIEIKTSDPRYFSSDTKDLKYLSSKLNLILSANANCPTSQKIALKGSVNGALYYAGAVYRKDRWSLRGLYSSPNSRSSRKK